MKNRQRTLTIHGAKNKKEIKRLNYKLKQEKMYKNVKK